MSQTNQRRVARRQKYDRTHHADDVLLCAMITEHGHQRLTDDAPVPSQETHEIVRGDK